MTLVVDALVYLKGKVAQVTGAPASIGRSIAPCLSEADASVAVDYRGESEDAETVVACLHIVTLGANRYSPPHMQRRPSSPESKGEPKSQLSCAIAPQTPGIRLQHDRDPRALRRRFARSDTPA
jgi:NAD(P)-dependent dehydrogenase (short-subunit alcohol dehydrogenase family)